MKDTKFHSINGIVKSGLAVGGILTLIAIPIFGFETDSTKVKQLVLITFVLFESGLASMGYAENIADKRQWKKVAKRLQNDLHNKEGKEQ